MIIYLIKSGVCLAIVLTIYHLFLEKEKMHQFNRFYLLFGLIFSFAAPLVTLEYSGELFNESILWQPVKATGSEFTDSAIPNQINTVGLQVESILPIIYFIGFSLLLIQFFVKIFNLLKKVFQYKKVKYKNARLVLIEEDYLPHTFLNFIFINREAFEKEKIEEELFTHELAHAEQRHSIDVLIVEVFKTIFWFNPLLYFYKRAMQLNHEFLADDAVLENLNQVSDYQYLLLNKAASNKRIYLASNLNFLVTKKRLKMMTKNTSRLKVNTLATMTIPLFVCMLLLFGNKVEAQKNGGEKETIIPKEQVAARDAYFKDATFVCEENENKKVYKAYKDLTDEERMAIPPPPPPPPTADGKSIKIAPLPKGTLVHYDLKGKDKRVWVDQSGASAPPPPPPPPPPAPPAPPKPPKASKGNKNQ